MDVPDHRRIGRQLKIYATDKACGAGLPLWLPAGAAVRSEIERFIVDLERRDGYSHVYTPSLAKQELYERSGHWDHFREDMYPPMHVGGDEVVLRPMNCPHHILVYRSEPRSSSDLPLRLAELGNMFRLERSGVVGGLSRVRQMTLNDGHVFCAAGDVETEIARIVDLVYEAYRALAIPEPRIRLSQGGHAGKFAGDAGMWERAEAMIGSALAGLGLDYEPVPGEAAFYGPKIDLQVSDPRGREETLSTVQVDFHLPERFALSFRGASGLERPVMIHRSIVSTMERMVAHLLEVHGGALPVWLAPTQVVVLPTRPSAVGHAIRVRDAICREGLRIDLDGRDATLASRVRDAQTRHVPYVAIVGDREAAADAVSVRLRTNHRLPVMGVGDFIRLAVSAVATRSSSLT